MEEEKKFIIREDQIKEIELHLNNHSLIPVRAMLKQLPLLEEKINKKQEVKNGTNKT
jgi:hypothetical protein